jgi:hypothetical protein
MRGDSVGTSIRGPESQEGTCEYMKGPIALPRKFYFDIFFGIGLWCLTALSTIFQLYHGG